MENNNSHRMGFGSKTTRTYSTEANLLNSDNYKKVQHLRHMVVRTPDGRWTAVFFGAECISEVLHGGTGFTIVG